MRTQQIFIIIGCLGIILVQTLGTAYSQAVHGAMTANETSLTISKNYTTSTGFGVGGKVLTDFSPNSGLAEDLALQFDGKLVAVGYRSTPSVNEIVLVRYNSDGTLDETFGSSGIITTSFETNSYAFAVTIQPDNKIVVAGKIGASFGVVRYNSDGSLDSSFNGTGVVMTSFGSNAGATDLVIQSDGKILVAGNVGPDWDTPGDFALVRYNTNGSLDTSFNSTGKLVKDLGGDDFASALVLRPNGKIVVAGRTAGNFAIMQCTTDGSLDTSFNSTGIVMTDFGGADFATDLVVQLDGKILATGGGGGYFALARYNTDGTLDTSFGNGGKLTTDFGTSGDNASGIALQATGEAIVVGTTHYDFALVRYGSSGNLDNSFGNDGKVITDFDGYDTASALIIQPDGKIVAAGYANNGRAFALSRYLTNGSLDKHYYTVHLPLILHN